MKLQNTELTNAKQAMEEIAKKESPFTCGDFAEEIALLLNEYFLGQINCSGNKILCTFLNGQRFALTVEKFPA